MFNIFNMLKILNNVFIPVTPGTNNPDPDTDNNSEIDSFFDLFSGIIDKYKGLAIGIFGLLTIALVILLIYLCINLANSANNPDDRKTAMMRILACLVVVALFGSITLIFGLFWNSLR